MTQSSSARYGPGPHVAALSAGSLQCSMPIPATAVYAAPPGVWWPCSAGPRAQSKQHARDCDTELLRVQLSRQYGTKCLSRRRGRRGAVLFAAPRARYRYVAFSGASLLTYTTATCPWLG